MTIKMTGVSKVNKDDVKALLDARKKINLFLWDKREQLEALQSSKSVGCADWVIELAENLTMTARAPTHWAPPRPLHEFKGHPPAPQFEQMRAGWLEKYHQKHLKTLKSDTTIQKESSIKLMKFERKVSINESLARKRGRDDGDDDEELHESTKKRAREEEDLEISVTKNVGDDVSRKRKTGLNFGLDNDSDSDSDSE